MPLRSLSIEMHHLPSLPSSSAAQIRPIAKLVGVGRAGQCASECVRPRLLTSGSAERGEGIACGGHGNV